MKRPPSGDLLQEFGSPGRTRTTDQVINSHPLYQLSYRGIVGCRFAAGAKLSSAGSLKSSGDPGTVEGGSYAAQCCLQSLQPAGKRQSDMARCSECRARHDRDLRFLKQELGEGDVSGNVRQRL